MFWVVFEINILSILNSSTTIKITEKVLVKREIVMTGSFVSFLVSKTI